MRSRRGWKSSLTSFCQASPFTPLPPQCSLKSTWVSRCGKTSSRSTSISRVPQNGGSGTGLSVGAAERTLSSSVRSGSGPRPLVAQALRGLAHGLHELGARALLDDLVHLVEALEGVLAVEDAGRVDLVGL